jgi:hypothetical protein
MGERERERERESAENYEIENLESKAIPAI